VAALGRTAIVFGLLGGFRSSWVMGKTPRSWLLPDKSAQFLIVVFLAPKPLATVLCLGSGAPGGLCTPSLTLGALLGGALGYVWTLIWPGAPLSLFAVIGAGSVIAATTQGPVSAAVLMIELTGHDRASLL
jgi:chloride channel protein, CIC family